MKLETVNILGFKIARMNQSAVLDWISVMVESKKPHQLVTANAEILYLGVRDADFRRCLQHADLMTADGAGVVWASRFLGQPLPERVAGVDLLSKLFVVAEEKGWGVYFLGARREVLEKAILNTLTKHPRLKVAGFRDGYFAPDETKAVMENIYTAKPQLLLVALGVPRQEFFIHDNLKELNVPICIGVGGSFDILAGEVKRAPLWMQQSGLEWLYRLLTMPSRFMRVLALPLFVLRVFWQRVSSK